MKYGILGAMDSEVALLTTKMTDVQEKTMAGLTFYDGVLCGQQAVVVKCGVGKVNAAACAQMLIDRFCVETIINVGVAGGVSSQLNVLDVVVGTALVQHDFDLRPFGYVKGFLGRDYGDETDRPTYFEADKTLVSRAVQAASAVLGDEHTCYEGVIASGDEFVASSERRVEIASSFNAMASEMEGASIAQVAFQNGIPFLVLRIISDLADGSAPLSFETVVQFAADKAALIIMAMLAE